jgi:chemotaxis family two-component system response regulator Rcp1
MELIMFSSTKVSPKKRDWVPRGFFIDDKTWDVRLLAPRGQEKRSRRKKHPGRAGRILLVEDNPGDVRLVQEALGESKLSNTLNVVENGVEALAFLRRQGKYCSAPRPDLILLDLNLPLKDGREVLREIKQDADLRRIPVVVLTSSKAEHDILKTYDLHANCYIRKRMDLDQFIMVIQLLRSFWCRIVQLPPEDNAAPVEVVYANP